MRELSSDFMDELKNGRLVLLLDKVKRDSDLDLQIREGYINIYFKGNNLLKLKEDLTFEIDKKFTDGKEDTSFSTQDNCSDFIKNKLPQIKEKIIDAKNIKNTLEIEYEQLLIRANNYTNSVNSEYLIVDRQYARVGEQRKNQMDLFGVFVDRGRRGSQSLLAVPFVAEVKYSLNPDISNLPEQINRYYQQIAKDYNGFASQAEILLHQKAELGLFDLSNGLVDKLKSAKVDEGIKNLRIIIVLVDYNPYSTKFGPDVISQLKNLPYSDQIYIYSKQDLPFGIRILRRYRMKIAEWIADEDKLKGAEIFAAIVTIIAGGIWIYLDGFTGETLAQVMATLGGAVVIVISFLQHQRKQDITNFITAGSRALEKLQKAYPDILSGPKIFKDDYVPGEDSSKQEYKKYLFFQRPVETGKEKAQFIPVTPFEEAIIEIYVSSKALKIAEISNPSEEAHKEIHENMKSAVRKAIRELANKEYNGLFEDKGIDSSGKDVDFKDKNLCVALDFYDDKISYKQFEKIVNRIGQAAIETLRKG